MRRRDLAVLAVLGLAGCGIYGPPERAAVPAAAAPAGAPCADPSDQACREGDAP